MALFMDIHEKLPEGATAADVAGAHKADLETQSAYAVNYVQYWVSETEGKVFCLVEAPDAQAAREVHQQAHGLVADRIVEVVAGA